MEKKSAKEIAQELTKKQTALNQKLEKQANKDFAIYIETLENNVNKAILTASLHQGYVIKNIEELLVIDTNNVIIDKLKLIAEEFSENFNAIKNLGTIDHKTREYFMTLLGRMHGCIADGNVNLYSEYTTLTKKKKHRTFILKIISASLVIFIGISLFFVYKINTLTTVALSHKIHLSFFNKIAAITSNYPILYTIYLLMLVVFVIAGDRFLRVNKKCNALSKEIEDKSLN